MSFRTNVLLVILLFIHTSYAAISSVISKPPTQMTSSLRSSMQATAAAAAAATPSITKIEFNSMPPAQRPQISNGKFQCLHPDGESNLYNEVVGGRQFTFRCLKGTKCYGVPNRPNEIKCAYASLLPTPVSSPPERFSSEPTSSVNSYVPTSPVLMASEKFFVGTMAPTSSEPRVISVDVILPTIVIEITEDPNGPPNLSTVISVNPTNGSIKDNDVDVETVTTTEVVPRPDRLDDFQCVSERPVPTVYDYNELLKIMRESVAVPPPIPFMPRTTPMESTYVPPMSQVSSNDQMDPPNNFSPWPTPAPKINPHWPIPPPPPPAVQQPQPKKSLAQPFGRPTPPPPPLPPIKRPRPASDQPMTTHDGLLTIVINPSMGLSDGLSSALQHQQPAEPAKTPHPMLPNDPRPPILMSDTNNRPSIPFVSNGTRQSPPPMVPSTSEPAINNNGIIGILQDILHIPSEAITIDGHPVVVKTASSDDDTDVEDEGQPTTEKSVQEDDLENDNRFRGGGNTGKKRPKGNIKIKDPSTRTVVINGGTRPQIAHHHHQNMRPIKVGGSIGRFPDSVVRLAQSVDEEAEDYDTLGPPPSIDQDYLVK